MRVTHATESGIGVSYRTSHSFVISSKLREAVIRASSSMSGDHRAALAPPSIEPTSSTGPGTVRLGSK